MAHYLFHKSISWVIPTSLSSRTLFSIQKVFWCQNFRHINIYKIQRMIIQNNFYFKQHSQTTLQAITFFSMTEKVGKGIRTSNNFFTSDFYKFGETDFWILSKYIFLIQSCFPFATSTWKSFLDFFIKLFMFSNIFICRIKSINIKSFSKFVCRIFISIFVLASMIVNINKYYKQFTPKNPAKLKSHNIRNIFENVIKPWIFY